MPLSRDRSRASPASRGAVRCSTSWRLRLPSRTSAGGTAPPCGSTVGVDRTMIVPRGARMLKLACQEQLLPGDDLVAKFDFARRAGFAGIERRAKGDGHFAGRLPELRAAARAGVVMRTVCPDTDHFIGDFDADQRRDAVEQLRSQLSVIAELGGEGVLTPASWGMFSLRLPPFTPPRTPEEDRKVLLDALCDLAVHAQREGVWLALEALNRYEDYMLNRLEQV